MPPPPIAAPLENGPYEDRKTGLILFGLMTVLFGGVCALFVPLLFFGHNMAPTAAPPPDPKTMLMASTMLGMMAVTFIWLGIGSMLARRWARALLLILSWAWLIIGLSASAFMAIGMPKILAAVKMDVPAGQPAPPAEIMSAIFGFTLAIMVVIYVVVPAVWIFFYQSRNVKATCEAEDPFERWTDRCPLPVIAVCVWLAFSAPWMLFMGLAYKGVIPLFGMFLVGPAGTAFYVLLAALWGYGARAMYRLQPSGWWIVTVSVVLFAVSAFLTYSRHDVNELYALMGYPEAQLAQLRKFNFMTGMTVAWVSLGAMLPLLGYMWYLRRYFVRAPEE